MLTIDPPFEIVFSLGRSQELHVRVFHSHHGIIISLSFTRTKKIGNLIMTINNSLTIKDGLNGLCGIIIKVHRKKYNKKLLNILLCDNRITKLYDNEINLKEE